MLLSSFFKLLWPSQKTSTVLLFHEIFSNLRYNNITFFTPVCPICTLEHIGQSWVNNDFCSVEQFINEAGLRLYNPIFIGRWTHWSSFTIWGYPFLDVPKQVWYLAFANYHFQVKVFWYFKWYCSYRTVLIFFFVNFSMHIKRAN